MNFKTRSLKIALCVLILVSGTYSVYARFPNESNFEDFWGLDNVGQDFGTIDVDIDAPRAWDVRTNANNVLVAVIDTGIDYNNNDYGGNLWFSQAEIDGVAGEDDDGNGYIDDMYGYNTVDDNNDPLDQDGHGTHVAGIIGARGNNGFGMVGVAWSVQMLNIKAMESIDNANVLDVIEAIQYAMANNADIIHISWSDTEYHQELQDAINEAHDAGILVIAAAGDDDFGGIFYPAAMDNVLSVVGINRTGQGATTFNQRVDISAPGIDIESWVLSGPLVSKSGSPMAAAYASGVAALLKAQFPTYTNEDIHAVIKNNTKFLHSTEYIGEGLLSAERAITHFHPQPYSQIEAFPKTLRNPDRIDIRGKARGPNFDSYEIQFARGWNPSESDFVTRVTSPQPDQDGLLVPDLLISSLGFGRWTFRLKVNSTQSFFPAIDRFQFEIINEPEPVTVSFDLPLGQTEFTVQESEPHALIPIVFSGPSNSSVRVNARTMANTASPIFDYVQIHNLFLDFDSQNPIQYMQVELLQDNYPDGDKLVTLLLQDPIGGTVEGPASVSLRIIDTDSFDGVFFQQEIATYNENHGEGLVAVERIGDLSNELTVVARSENGQGPTAALEGVHFEPVEQTLTWRAGDRFTRYVFFNLIDNQIYEGDKSFLIRLSDIEGGTLGANDSIEINILEDEFDPNSPLVPIAGPDLTFVDDNNDGFHQGRIDVSRSYNPNGEIERYRLIGGGWAVSSSDPFFDPSPRYAVGTHELTLVIEDSQGDAASDTLNLSVIPPHPDNRYVQIKDLFYSVDENSSNGTVQIELERIGNPAGEVIVGFTASDLSISGNQNYNPISTAITWPDGDTASKFISIELVDDFIQEGDDVVQLTLSNPVRAAIIGGNPIELVIVEDEDGSNIPPVADAGEDETRSTPSETGFNMWMNAGDSFDPDGEIVEYIWELDGEVLSNDVSFLRRYPIGVHSIQLTVVDNDGASATDEIILTITRFAQGDGGGDQTIYDYNQDGTRFVRLDASASQPSTFGTEIVRYRWTENNQEIYLGPDPIITLDLTGHGQHILGLTVRDDQNVGSGQRITYIDVLQPGVATMGNFDGDSDIDLDDIQAFRDLYELHEGSQDLDLLAVGDFNADGTFGSEDVIGFAQTLIQNDPAAAVAITEGALCDLGICSPAANAGGDRVISTELGASGFSEVTLDGSLSMSNNGEPLVRYKWTAEDLGPLVETAEPLAQAWIRAGDNKVTLEVENSAGLISSDQATITLNDIPHANAGSDQTLTDTGRDGVVGLGDFAVWNLAKDSSAGQSHWNPWADFNRDGVVDIGDISDLIGAWGSRIGDPNYNQDVDVDGLGFEEVTLDSSRSQDLVGGIKEYIWARNDAGLIYNGPLAKPTITLAAGRSYLLFHAVRDHYNALSNIDTLNVTINSPVVPLSVAKAQTSSNLLLGFQNLANEKSGVQVEAGQDQTVGLASTAGDRRIATARLTAKVSGSNSSDAIQLWMTVACENGVCGPTSFSRPNDPSTSFTANSSGDYSVAYVYGDENGVHTDIAVLTVDSNGNLIDPDGPPVILEEDLEIVDSGGTSKQIFSPGRGEVGEVQFHLLNPHFVEIDIADRRGNIIRNLIRADYPAGTHTITWDGRDAQGQIVASGAYSVIIRAGSSLIKTKLVVVN